jgi:hypothetical protein
MPSDARDHDPLTEAVIGLAIRTGLMMNFHSPALKGIRRFVP